MWLGVLVTSTSLLLLSGERFSEWWAAACNLKVVGQVDALGIVTQGSECRTLCAQVLV